MSKLLKGDALERRCAELGVSIEGSPRTQSSSGNSPRASDAELQRRLIETERSLRESRLWWIALISAIASALSAAIALLAFLYTKCGG